MSRIIHDLGGATPLGRPFAIAVVVAALFVLAWLVSRAAARVAAYSIDRSDRRRLGDEESLDTVGMTSLRQRTTAISLVQTSVRYLAFAFALVLSVVALSGAQRLQTIVGASFLAVLIGFAAQRFLTDVVAGLLMFFEGWFRIGDTVTIDPWNVRGVVEAVSLRSLTIRSVTGEIVHVPNSQVIAMRVIPRGFREVEVELFTSELEPAHELVEEIARIVPTDPTRFVRRPRVAETDQLDGNLFRITVSCAVAVGREWLAEDFLPTLIRERASEGLLVHGPIVTFTDPQATRSFARALMVERGRSARGQGGASAWPGEARFAPPTEEDGRA